MSTSTPTHKFTLAGLEYEVGLVTLGLLAKIVPKLISVSQKMARIDELVETDFDAMVEVVALALQNRYPAITVERLMHEPIGLSELVNALRQISEAIGLTDPPAPAPEPEALEPEPAHG